MNRLCIGGLALGLVVSSCSNLTEEFGNSTTSSSNEFATNRLPDAPAPVAYRLAASAGVEELVAQAKANHPAIKALRAKANALDQAARQARFLPDPSASVGVGELAETAAGQVQAVFGVQQKIPYPGKRNAQAKVFLAQAEAVRAEAESKEIAIAELVRKAWWQYYQSQQTTVILVENRGLLETLQQSVQTRIAVNQASQQDFLKLENEITRIDQRLATARGQAIAAQSSLNALLYRPNDSSLPNASFTNFRSFGPPSVLIALASNNHPEVKAARARIAAADSRVELARLSSKPDFTAGASYSPVTEDALAPSANGKDQVMATLGVTIPLWGGKTKANREEAAANLTAEQEALASTRTQLQREIGSAHALFTSERKALSLFSSNLIPDAESVFELTLNSYQSGKDSFLAVIDAWRQLLMDRLQVVESQARLGQAEASLLKAAGRN